MKITYKTESYNALNAFLYLYGSALLIVFLIISIAMWLKVPILSVIGFICIVLLPYLFEKKIKQWFTKKFILEFDNLSFTVKKCNKEDDGVYDSFSYLWDEIKSYRFYFTAAKISALTIFLRNGEKKSWAFKDNKSFQEAISGESLFSIFHSNVKQFNTNKDVKKQIALSSGFFTTKAGATFLYFEGIIITFGFGFHLIMHPQSSVLSLLLGFSIILQQLMKRRQEKVFYDKIRKLDYPPSTSFER